MFAHDLRPDCITLCVHVQLVVEIDVRLRFAVIAEHVRMHVDEAQSALLLGIIANEPIGFAWLVAVTSTDDEDIRDEDRGVCVEFGPDTLICDVDDEGKEWQVWSHEHELGACETKGQFRALCRGLGIDLKDTDQ